MPLWRKRHRFHGLKRPKIRQDMKKENLYNISRMTIQRTSNRTFYQQKWTAKSLTRAYHGEQIREGQWTRMFDRNTNAVMPMNPKYLATHTGVDQSAGRGSGLEPHPEARIVEFPKTPYMQMVYHPTERRLDTAIFRALFASSARQARQHVTHGHVRVNGKLIRHPGYMLNPGDMFQVEPERVMYSMGAPKSGGMPASETDKSAAADQGQQEAETETTTPAAVPQSDQEASGEGDLASELDLLSQAEVLVDSEGDSGKQVRDQLKELRSKTKEFLEVPSGKMSKKTKQELRAFSKELRSSMSKAKKLTPSELDDLSARMEDLTMKVNASQKQAEEAVAEIDSTKKAEDGDLQAKLDKALEEARENPVDPRKPYATPWRPRDFMSAFAFIPRYLEVNHKICSAVYLRHPACRPGIAEVPTPFHPETGQLAFNWYLKRR